MNDVEAIKQLKARYFRFMDTKQWDDMRALFTDDVHVDTTASGGPVFDDADGFVSFLRETLGDAITVHQGHMPEIELTSPTTATGIWALHDTIVFATGMRLVGYGHYHEIYAKNDEVWRIASSTLTRLHMDLSAGAALE